MLLRINGKELSGYVVSVSSSGSKTGCARTLDAQIVQSSSDPNIANIELSTGAQVQFDADGYSFFGVLSSLKRSGESSIFALKAHDMGLYLKRNTTTHKIRGLSPAAAARVLCGRFNVKTGYLEETGTTFDRNFVGTSLYSAIMTGYTFAAEQTKGVYQVRCSGSLMTVIQRGTIIAGTAYPKSNLMSAAYDESIERVVNRVDLYDKEGNLSGSVYGDTSIGIMAQAMTITDTRGREYAEKIIRDNKLERSGSIQIMGNPRAITGNAIMVYDPYTKLYGKFYIDADTHTWKSGIYTTKLTLNFENTMDEQEAGSEFAKSSTKEKSVESANEASLGSHYGPNGELIYTYP
ncbi:MAG: hypothetical protein IKZ82_10855 [Clostridia bacterium]|nr:hypothetical protein [Clostridia bacterium]